MATDVKTRQFDQSSLIEEEESSWALFALAWRRKWIVLMMVAISLGLGYLFFLKQTPVYQSMAKVLIVRDSDNGPIDELKISSSYDTVHETLIRSPRVLVGAIQQLRKNGDINSYPSLAPLWRDLSHIQDETQRQRLEEERDLLMAQRLMGGLRVEVGHKYSGEILLMRYQSTFPEECKPILFAVHAAYADYQLSIYEGEGEDTADLVKRGTEKLREDLGLARTAYTDFCMKAGLQFSKGLETQNVHSTRAADYDSQIVDLKVETDKIQAKVEQIQAALKDNGSREALNLLVKSEVGEVDDVISVDDTLAEKVFPLLTEKAELMDSLGPDHPKVRLIDKKILLTREFIRGLAGDDEEQRDILDVFLETKRNEIEMNNKQLARLDVKYDDESEKALKKSRALFKADELKSVVANLQTAYDVFFDELRKVELLKGGKGTTVDLFHPPSTAYQVEPDFTTVMVTAGVLGMLAGMGLAFLVDRADRRFHSPDEIRTDLGIPVVGHIPVLPGIKPGKRTKNEPEVVPGVLAPALRSHHHPRGRIAEAYRAVRTALYFSTRGSGHQVIQITSPSPGDGKSTLSGNLAISIANSGKRALLIDADFRRPRIHRLFGLDNSSGISSVIEGKTEVVDAVQKTHVENLWIMSCGPRPDNPAELLSSKRFDELLGLLREQYDLVIVDTPPVLAVTDPLNVVPRVDGVLLVLRLTKSARTAGRRALESLDGMGAKVLGIVINGVGNQKGRYGYGTSYGKYGYSYGGKSGYGGYRYGTEYGYDYRYGYGDDNTYYEDDLPTKKNGKAAVAATK